MRARSPFLSLFDIAPSSPVRHQRRTDYAPLTPMIYYTAVDIQPGRKCAPRDGALYQRSGRCGVQCAENERALAKTPDIRENHTKHV